MNSVESEAYSHCILTPAGPSPYTIDLSFVESTIWGLEIDYEGVNEAPKKDSLFRKSLGKQISFPSIWPPKRLDSAIRELAKLRGLGDVFPFQVFRAFRGFIVSPWPPLFIIHAALELDQFLRDSWNAAGNKSNPSSNCVVRV